MSKFGRIGIAGPCDVRPFLDYFDLRGSDPATLPKGLGGTPVIHLVNEFLSRGHQVSVYTLDAKLTKPVVLTGPQLKMYVGPYRPSGWRAVDFFRAERSAIESFIRQDQPDFVHAHWTYEFALGALATGLPTLVTAHDAPFSVLEFDKHPYRLLRTLMALRVAKKAKFMTAVSDEVVDHWRQKMGFSGSIESVPNGMPKSFFERAQRRLGKTRPDRPVTFACVLVGWAGRKNGPSALTAFAKVHRENPETRLLLFGAGHAVGEPGHKWAKEHGLTDGVEFIGMVPYDQLAQRLEDDVDVFVHPALEEALCMAVAEAMCMGFPVIADKNTAGMKYLLGEGEAGILTDMRRPDELARHMTALAKSPEQRHAYNIKAIQLAKQRLTMALVADRYERSYGRMLGGER